MAYQSYNSLKLFAIRNNITSLSNYALYNYNSNSNDFFVINKYSNNSIEKVFLGENIT